MSPYRPQKVLPKKAYPEAETWDIENGSLKRSRSTCVCMTCKYLNHCHDNHCRAVLTCRFQQRLIHHGEHINSRCALWFRRIEKKIGWYPEVA